MKSLLLKLAGVALVATVVLAIVLDLHAKRRGLAVAAYLDLLCLLALVALAAAVRSALPAGRELHRRHAPRRSDPLPRPQQLEWFERQIGDARGAGFELPAHFARIVRQIAAAALVRRHGVVLERDPNRARALVSERVWQLIRADDPGSELPAGGFEALVSDLEAI
jgi:hypothetical protein